MTSEPPEGPAQPREQRLFRSRLLTNIFGPSVATLVTRSAIIIAVLGTLALIMGGLLLPSTSNLDATAPAGSASATTHSVGSEVGNSAPNFTLGTLGGKRVSLSDYRGQPVILNFWYATCPGCLAETPDFQKFYAAQHTAGHDVVIMGVNIVDDAPTALQFVQHYGVTYPIVLDPSQQVETLYNVDAAPTSYFIDSRGIIRRIVVGPIDDVTLSKDIAGSA